MIGTYARAHPDKAAGIIAETGETLTYGQLYRRATQLAHLFRDRGLREGDRVAILLDNSLDWFVVMWAARFAGLYYVPVNWHLKAAEARYVVENCDARAIVTGPPLIDLAGEMIRGVAGVDLPLTTGEAGQGFESLAAATASCSDRPLPPGAEGAVMPYSSGTSGRPKGVLRALRTVPPDTPSVLDTLVAAAYGVGEDTVYLSPAPQYHGAPVAWTMSVLFLGGTVVMMRSFDAAAALRSIDAYGITHAQFVPTHFVRLLRLPDETRRSFGGACLRVIIHAAAPCPPEVKLRIIEWFGPIVTEYYGGSERFGMTTISAAEWLTHRGSVGRSQWTPAHILDPDTREELATGETGMIYFEGVAGFAYHKDPVKSRETVTAEGLGTLGDMGWIDEDGYLYLADRRSDLILSGGVNIYPLEIENVLITHPAVGDVAVFGVPDAEFGEAVKAVVELRDGYAPGPALGQELIDYCRHRIAAFKAPRSVDFIDRLPRHPSGKLLKREVRDRYRADGPATTAPAPA